jgi:hypothetical protein
MIQLYNFPCKALVADFEKESNNLGPEFTHFWLRDYEKYENSEMVEVEEDEEGTREGRANASNLTMIPPQFSLDKMSNFLRWPEFKHWNGFLRFR